MTSLVPVDADRRASPAAVEGVGTLPIRLASSLDTIGETPQPLQVVLSNELVELLSTQMYQSPTKAIEELVVNAYDAEASECYVFVPENDDNRQFIAVLDNGTGMDYAGMIDLWHIGHSAKRDYEVEKRTKRKLIGKFGIGKLASYTLARFITYVSRKDGVVRYVALDFSAFKRNPEGASEPVSLRVQTVSDVAALLGNSEFRVVCEACGVAPEDLFEKCETWTLCVLEELKEKAKTMRRGRLRWVLSTAMPLRTDFRLFLNRQEIVSAKAAEGPIVEFSIHEISRERLQNLAKESQAAEGAEWRVVGDALVSKEFPSGVSGTVIVTRNSLYGGKSADLGRSNGFFVRVRGRLINENEPLFGLHPLTFEIFNRFRADINADDLDGSVVAPREGIGETEQVAVFRRLLAEVFNEARERYKKAYEELEKKELRRREHERKYVAPRLVEHPIADVLSSGAVSGPGAEADESWFYIDLPSDADVAKLASELYEGRRARYRFRYSSLGRQGRLASFDPQQGCFTINADHELVLEYAGDPRASDLLMDVVVAEVLLEVYLRENGVPAHIAGEILERRDGLFRSLAKDHAYSVRAIGQSLRDSRSSERDLEMALVAAARALGFVAMHIGGDGEPDGIATFSDHTRPPVRITLEAKSSTGEPTLAHLDFSGLAEHMRKHGAAGCLLVAPSYPGSSRGNDSAVANRAVNERISCWTVDDLARVVELAEARHINAKQVIDIVLNYFAPQDVKRAIEDLLSDPHREGRELYSAVMRALLNLRDRLPGAMRTVDMIAIEVSREPEFKKISIETVREAVRALAHASKGALVLRNDTVLYVNVDYDEVIRRLNGFVDLPVPSRRKSTFRDSEMS